MSLKKSKKRWRQATIVVISICCLLCVGYIAYLVSGLPSLEQLENPKPELATKVYSVDGEILDKFYIKNRTSVTLEEIPPQLIKALIATEDKNFYDHWGVDLPRFFRAMIKNILQFRLREGASTITQQLARNLYEFKGTQESLLGKITRKFREFITAIQIERNYTKEEILEMYLSVAYFGRSAYGIASATQIYFAKQPSQLSTGECAFLIGLLKGPATYDPWKHYDRAISRRNVVLNQMVKYNYISREEAEKIKNEQLRLRSQQEQQSAGIAPHFVEMIRQQLLQKVELYGFDIYRDGLSVYTTLDSRMQLCANRAVEQHLSEYQKAFNKTWQWKNRQQELEQVITTAIRSSEAYQRAPIQCRDSVARELRRNREFVDSLKRAATQIEVGFVAIDHRSGEIRAMVGGSNFKNFKYGLNHVTQIRRQPGSAFKPFVYTVAIDNGYPPFFEMLNLPVTIPLADGTRWTPSNADNRFGGKNTLREGLKYSINLLAVRAIIEIAPVTQVIDYAHRMGIKSELPPYESLSMGTGEVSPLEITSAFGVFANEGIYVEPISILRIEDKYGNVIEENISKKREVLNPETAYIITSMLEDVVNGGTGTRVREYFHLPCAGKTGTTQEFADAWFIGYTPDITAGVWVGFDHRVVHFTNWDGQGGRAAAPIWGRFMKCVYDDPDIGMQLTYFNQPEGIERAMICSLTKGLATEYCPNQEEEIFNKKYPPPRCSQHGAQQTEYERKSKLSF